MPSASDMDANQHLKQACELLDKSKEQAALLHPDVAAVFAAWSQAHAAIATAAVATNRPVRILKGPR